MSKEQLISVIIPVYNCEKYLAEAIESVLSQADCNLDVVVLDDGSTDSSAEIAKQYLPHIKYFYQPNGGLASALNLGISKAEGEHIAFLDADDRWLPNKLCLQMKALEAEPTLDMVFGHMRHFFSPDLEETLRAKIALVEGVVPSYFKGAMLIRRESLSRAGLFDTQWKIGDFVDWYLKALEKGLKSFMISDLVMERRVHGNNMVITQKKFQSDYLRILKASLDRRRAKE